MSVVALLSWYDEEPDVLAASIPTWAALCDRVIALDGAYASYPGGGPRSDAAQHDAIQQAASDAGMGASIITPSSVWRGEQIEKRNALLRHASTLTKPTDWYLMVDADEFLTAPADAREWLARTRWDVAEITVVANTLLRQRRIVRALPGLRVERLHWRLMDGDRCLWGHGHEDNIALALNLTDDVVLRHRRDLRPPERLARQRAYYDTTPEEGYVQ